MQERENIAFAIGGQRYDYDVVLSTKLIKIIQRLKNNEFFRDDIEMDEILVFDYQNKPIDHDTKLKDIKKSGDQLFIRFQDKRQMDQNIKSEKEEKQLTDTLESREYSLVESYLFKQDEKISQPAEKIHEVQSFGEQVKIQDKTEEKREKSPQKEQIIDEKKNQEIQSQKKSISENDQQKKIKQIFHEISSIIDDFPPQYQPDEKIDENNIKEYLVQLKRKLKQKKKISQAQQIMEGSRDLTPLSTVFLGNLLGQSEQKTIFEEIETFAQKEIRKIHSVFNYKSKLSPQNLTQNVKTYTQNAQNLLFFIQTQNDMIFGGFTGSKWKKNPQGILFWIEEGYVKKYNCSSMIKDNPFSCFVLGNYEVQILPKNQSVEILYYGNVKNSIFKDDLKKRMEKISNRKVRTIQILSIQFRQN